MTRKAITAMGFLRLNNWIGASFSSPNTLQIGAETVGNPYIERTGTTTNRVTTRRIGISRNAAGALVAIDLTVTYDLDDYAACEIFDAWKPGYQQQAPQPWGRIVAEAGAANAQPHEKVISCPGGIFLVVDLTNKKAIALYSQLMQRQKFAERNAVSICERNILKRFAGTSFADDEGYVSVVHWSQPDRTRQQMQKVFDKIQAGEVQIEGEDVQVEQVSESVDYEEATAILAGEADDAPEDREPEKVSKSPARRKK